MNFKKPNRFLGSVRHQIDNRTSMTFDVYLGALDLEVKHTHDTIVKFWFIDTYLSSTTAMFFGYFL